MELKCGSKASLSVDDKRIIEKTKSEMIFNPEAWCDGLLTVARSGGKEIGLDESRDVCFEALKYSGKETK